MPLIVPLPQGVRNVLRACADHMGLVGVHPGLVLDKFALSWDDLGATQGLSERVQRPVIDQVVRLSASPPPDPPDPSKPSEETSRWFDDLVKRWERLTAGSTTFVGTTAAPLTLHLARASALENAGICLHPIYGFTYLPGSGLKGLARAFAETVWFPAQKEADRPGAEATVRRVFGYTDGPERGRASAGSVVFHDAWPREWPRLVTDILNSHHAKYYSTGEPPGDWEDPVPVYFLSVPTGVPFRFAVARRRNDVPQADLDLAADWLAGGLTVLGCGAKTATGYGHFTVDRPPPGGAPQDVTRVWGDVAEKAGRKVFRAALELVTPAFLAGADQTDASSCDLRPATLRGQLRWWWRTMHAGFVDIPTLRQMEAAVWGDTRRGGAVRVTVTSNGKVQPLPFDRKQITSAEKLPRPPDQKTTQGLTYHTFGADDNKKEGGQTIHVRRFYLAPGAKWDVGLTARGGQFPPASEKGEPINLPAELLLEQARAALVLLCHFGGVGAKARKGFGSFADLPGFDLNAIKRAAIEFRARCGFGGAAFQESRAGSPALYQMLGPVEVPTGGANWWLALDQLAAAAQSFAKKYKHRLEKKALGLPRRVGAPTSGTFQPKKHVKDRHAAPVLYHFDRLGGLLVARVVAFPAAELPNFADSTKLLQELLADLGGGLGARFDAHVKGAQAPGGAGAGAPVVKPPVGPQLKAGQKVTATIVADPKGKGRPFAEYQGLVGNILNPADLPAGLEVGKSELSLEIANVNVSAKQIAFRYKK